jgi:uncharacterized protein YheU (UPF0270 family)
MSARARCAILRRMSDERRVDVPFTALSQEALLGVVDDYVLREGTEYGSADVSLERKREQVMKQLRSGEALIVFDEATETCTIIARGSVSPEEGPAGPTE